MAIVDKQVSLQLVGLDGNAFALMGAWRTQARREKWTPEEIESVIKECTSGDYNHLLCTLMDHTKSPNPAGDDPCDICERGDGGGSACNACRHCGDEDGDCSCNR